ncbi:MAG TPA: TIGR04438 family Trp-rich protein [Albitalea sp.]|nr:TIGR04438 family Trp-rich protein [Albitalea sp.]
MALVILGVLLLVMKVADFGPVAAWPWWLVLAPFAGAVLWWAWADKSGWTKRREIDKMDAKREERRRKNLEALGMDHKGRRRK